ncbi:hypothetical protein PYW07_003011 [Mythimna separata]|uniref:Reverse transcriptase RNase H-like domain-containing protein n=1 Tax=Mythimna separata TaxID=271217 RepID=A0AAD7YHY1_MYTSE|nr:hypothetical protein PYW07_003011 [Mythimna separata]
MKSSLTEIAQNDLKWWLNHLETPSPIHVPHPTHYIVTDASDDAWGAYINNTYISGTWKAEEKHLHCNQKEMLAILKTIHYYGQRFHKASLYIQCDSKTAVSYLRNEGGTKSIALMDLAHQILRSCHIVLSAPGRVLYGMAPEGNPPVHDNTGARLRYTK